MTPGVWPHGEQRTDVMCREHAGLEQAFQNAQTKGLPTSISIEPNLEPVHCLLDFGLTQSLKLHL